MLSGGPSDCLCVCVCVCLFPTAIAEKGIKCKRLTEKRKEERPGNKGKRTLFDDAMAHIKNIYKKISKMQSGTFSQGIQENHNSFFPFDCEDL